MQHVSTLISTVVELYRILVPLSGSRISKPLHSEEIKIAITRELEKISILHVYVIPPLQLIGV